MTAVQQLYEEFKAASDILRGADEISLTISLDNNFRKVLLLCAASHFEHVLSKVVEEFTIEISNGNNLIVSLIKNKAISRQYHSWFDWDARNANKFFSLFGNDFRQYMSSKVESDAVLKESIEAFMEVGRIRNRLVHSDYGNFPLEKTADEIYATYQKAETFLSVIELELRSSSNGKIL